MCYYFPHTMDDATSSHAPVRPHPELSQDKRIAGLGAKLQKSIQAVLDGLSGVPQRQQALARHLGVNKNLTSRLLNALAQRDALAVIHYLPGPDPLRQVLRAAGERGAPDGIVRHAEEAVDEFDVLIRGEAGDRTYLDAIIGAWLPEARKHVELLHRQTIFKGMSHIKGAFGETKVVVAILFPDAPEEGSPYDVSAALVAGMLGLCRVRPDASITISSRRTNMPAAVRPTTLDGSPVEDAADTRLDGFCERPLPMPLQVWRAGDAAHYVIPPGSAGKGSSIDLIWAEVNRRCLSMAPQADSPRDGISTILELPYKELVLDVLLAEGVKGFHDPTLKMHQTSPRGLVDVNDEARAIDELDVLESLTPLRGGVKRYRLPTVPRYVDVIEHVCERLRLDAEKLEGWRVRMAHPLFGSQVSTVFERGKA